MLTSWLPGGNDRRIRIFKNRYPWPDFENLLWITL